MALAELQTRFESLSLRERLLVAAALAILLHQVWDFGWWQPHNKAVDGMTGRMISVSSDLKLTEKEFQGLTKRLGQDPNSALRQNLEVLQAQLDRFERQVSDLADELITPTRMAEMLEDLITREPDLKLVSLESLESEPLLAVDGEESTVSLSRYQLYRHGFAIEFQGSYLATLRYLEALDKLPWRFYWDRLDFQVQDYPISRVRLELHTLSLSEGWIGV